MKERRNTQRNRNSWGEKERKKKKSDGRKIEERQNEKERE